MFSEIKKQNVKNIFDLLRNAAKNFRDKTFVMYKEKQIIKKSFLETFKDSEKIALYTSSLANHLGHRVHAALIGKTSYEYLISMFGVFGGNGVAVPIDTQSSKENLVKNLLKADVDVLFFDWSFHSHATYVKKHIADRKIKFVCLQDVDYEDNVYSILASNQSNLTLPEIDPAKEALIIFTSGTTGEQKGVMLSHLNQIDNIFSIDWPNEPIPQSNHVLLNILPIHHIFCLNVGLFMPLRYGVTVCLGSDIKRTRQLIQAFNPTIILMVPMMAKIIMNYFSMTKKQNPHLPINIIKNMVFGKNLVWLIVSGASLSPNLEAKFIEIGVKINQGYGMTECSPIISFSFLGKIKSVGRPSKSCVLRIQDGEIQVKSPSVMIGYYKDPELTKQAFTEDGFLKTGDLGYVDDNGFVYVTGRKKNLIILDNGENVSPEAIEGAFEDELLIQDILVYENNNKIVAEVYPNFEYAKTINCDDIFSQVEKIVQEHNLKIPTYCQISNVSIRKQPFEKSSTNKILRHKHINKNPLSNDEIKGSSKPQTDLQKKIFKIVSLVTGNDKMGIDDDLFACGLNSLGSMMLIENFENEFRKSITFKDLSLNRTIRKIEKLIINQAQNFQKPYPPKKEYPLIDTQNYYAIIKDSTAGNLPTLLELDKNIDLEKLKNALETVIDSHPALKGIIKPGKDKQLKLFRDDLRKIEINIENLSDEEWKKVSNNLVTPFKFDGTDDLFHIRLFQTPSSKYGFFDFPHIMSDGITINILLKNINNCYMGQNIEKEKFSFYDYIVEYYEKDQQRKEDLQYYKNLLKGITLQHSILNRKGKFNLKNKDVGHIRKQMELLIRKKVIYFCERYDISENVFLYTAFNYCVGIFQNLKETFTRSTHSGRDDIRFMKSAGPFFKCYFCRYDVVPHETVCSLLKRTKRQILDTMKCCFSDVNHIEMFFQYQSDIYNISKICGLPAKALPIKQSDIPFHLEVMSNKNSYFLNLTYWKDRFDEKMISNFLTCYENIANAMLTEQSARMLKRHIPSEMFPHDYTVTAKELNDEAGYRLLKNVPDDQKVSVYVLDDSYEKKPIGAWGRLYLKDFEPTTLLGTIKYPYRQGVILYDTKITARIIPDGRIDFLENSGRVVLAEDSKLGLKYCDLGKLEKFVKKTEDVKDCRAYMTFNPQNGGMQLELEVQTNKDRFLNKIFADAEASLDQAIYPDVVKIIGK